MKKRVMKTFGVCAAAVIMVSAAAPTLTHAAEGKGAKIETRANDYLTTPNRLKRDASVNTIQVQDFVNWLSEKSITSIENNNLEFDKSIALDNVKDEHIKVLFTDRAKGSVAENLGLTYYNPDNLYMSDLLVQIFGEGSEDTDTDKPNENDGENTENGGNQEGETNPETDKPEDTDKPGENEGENTENGGNQEGETNPETDKPEDTEKPGGTEEGNTDGDEKPTSPETVKPEDTDKPTENEGEGTEEKDKETRALNDEMNERQNGIFITSDVGGLNGNDFKVGDEIRVKLWTNYGETGSKLKEITEVNVKVKDLMQEEDVEIKAHNLNKSVGDTYNIFEGLNVKVRETHQELVGLDIFHEGGVFYVLNEKGVAQELFKGDQKELDMALKDTNSDVYSKISNIFNLEIGQFYLLEDTSNFASGNRVDETVISNGIFNKEIKRTYGTALKNFDQELKLIVPLMNDDNDKASVGTYFANRFITVGAEDVDNGGENGGNNGGENGGGEVEQETKALYRAYNPNNGDHLFTESEKEYKEVIAAGWQGEGIAWYSPDSGTPVFRLYNPNSGEHFYTKSVKEYNEVADKGWKKEGIAFYSETKDEGGIPIYRSFNPNATGPGSHMFTDSVKEYNELTAAGWTPEGIAFYAAAKGAPNK